MKNILIDIEDNDPIKVGTSLMRKDVYRVDANIQPLILRTILDSLT